MCLKFYKLDHCHYFSFPGLSTDAMLKMTGEKLEKILDIYMYLFIEKELKGGISNIAKRYSEANNKYMKIVIQQNRRGSQNTLIKIICMTGQ